MIKLIKELKTEHQNIAAVFQQINALGIITEDAKKLLSKSKRALLDHLQKEDDQLYPPIIQQAQQDPHIAAMLKIFGEELKSLTTAVLAFFEKYEQSGNSKDFTTDFASIFAALGSRIEKEESILFKAYEKIIQEKK